MNSILSCDSKVDCKGRSMVVFFRSKYLNFFIFMVVVKVRPSKMDVFDRIC